MLSQTSNSLLRRVRHTSTAILAAVALTLAAFAALIASGNPEPRENVTVKSPVTYLPVQKVSDRDTGIDLGVITH